MAQRSTGCSWDQADDRRCRIESAVRLRMCVKVCVMNVYVCECA